MILELLIKHANSLAALGAIGSALGAFAAAWIMRSEAREARSFNNTHMEERKKAEKIQNNVAILKMFNEFNQSIFESNEEFMTQFSHKNFPGLGNDLVRRVYVQFSRINILEIAWFLEEKGDLPEGVGKGFTDAMVANLRADEEATRYALKDGTAYAESFMKDVWSKIFPGETFPMSGRS